jgi:hypothetical protein
VTKRSGGRTSRTYEFGFFVVMAKVDVGRVLGGLMKPVEVMFRIVGDE